MEQQDAFDLLLDYPRKHGLEFDTQDDYRRFYLFPTDSMLDTKFVIFKNGPLYFYAHDSHTAKLYMSSTFTGLYGEARPGDPELRVYKKDLANSLLRANKRKTGFRHIDDNLTITSATKDMSFHLPPEAVTLFLEMAGKFSPLQMIIENNYITNIADLKDKKVIGLETQQWLYREEDVEEFLKLGSEVLQLVLRD